MTEWLEKNWVLNEHGAWCPGCGYLIAPSFWEDWEAKADQAYACKDCGFPDYEDGYGEPG